MTLRLDDLDDDARYDKWSRVVERIYHEHINHAWRHYMFRLLRAVFTTNAKLSEEGGIIFKWMADNYVDAELMLVRRELDQQAGTENIRNLLFDMIENPTVVSRARYRSKWGENDPFNRADRVFDRFTPIRVAGNPDDDHIDPDVIRGDLDKIGASAERLREYAERTRAHRTPERRIDTAGMTFKTLHDAIADIRGVIEKYYTLLTLNGLVQWEPIIQFDMLEAFTKPWVTDRAAVEQATEDSSTK